MAANERQFVLGQRTYVHLMDEGMGDGEFMEDLLEASSGLPEAQPA